MTKLRIPVLSLALLLVGAGFAAALTDTATHPLTLVVEEIALIDLNSTTGMTLAIVAPSSGGQTPAAATNSSRKLMYTSVVSSGTRSITVVSSHSAPAGTLLKLQATVPAGCGVSAGVVDVNTSAAVLIAGIGNCATGTDGGSGAALVYTLELDSLAGLVPGPPVAATITFTLVDAS